MPYLSPTILEALGLRQRPEDEEEPVYESPMDAYRRGERAPVSPYAGITPMVPSPVTPAPEPNPYRQVGSMLWTGEEPSTTEPTRMIPTVRSVPITESPSGERTLRAPEGTATWRAGPQGFPPPGRFNDPADVARINARLQQTAELKAANEERARAAEERARAARDAPRQNLIADILSTSRSIWGRSQYGPKGELIGPEADRRARIGELLTILKTLYGTSALGGILAGEAGGGAVPGGLVPTGVTVDEKGGIKRTFGLPPSAKIGGGPGSRSYEDYVREAETKGLRGADRSRYADEQMRKAAEALERARGTARVETQYGPDAQRLKGQTATVTGVGRGLAEEELPLNEKAKNWLNPQTGQFADASMLLKEAKGSGYKFISDKALQATATARAALVQLDQYERLSKDLLTSAPAATDLSSNLINWGAITFQRAKLGFLKQSGHPKARALAGLFGTIATMARATGDTANIAVQERDMLKQSVPNEADSIESAMEKLTQMRTILRAVLAGWGTTPAGEAESRGGVGAAAPQTPSAVGGWSMKRRGQ